MSVPKAELHCHIEGAAPPGLVRRLAARYRIDLAGLFDDEGRYRRHDFTSFLAAYMAACAVFRTPEDFAELSESCFRSLAGHPVRRLADAGVGITLNADDPPFFHTTLEAEYDGVARIHGIDAAGLRRITRTAIEAAFVDEPTRAHLLERIA